MRLILKNHKRIIALYVIAFYAVTFVFQTFLLKKVEAVDLTEASVRLDRMDVSHLATVTDPIVVFAKIASTATEASVKLTFGSGFTVNGTPSNVTIDNGCSQGASFQGESATDWPGTSTAATAVSGQDVTISSSDLTPATYYSFCITGGVTNPGSGGTKEITITTQTSGPAAIDTKTVAVDIVSDNADQVTVTAAVPASFNFALAENAITLGDLSTTATVTDNVAIDVDTNAGNGWHAWVKSANAALNSASTSDAVNTQGTVDAAPTAYSTGVEHYQLDIDVTNGTGSGTPSADAEYTGTGGSGGTLTTAYTTIATSTGPGTDDGITFTIYAAASAINEAADDYTDTLTIIGAGNF